MALIVPSWYCSDRSNDEDAVLCIEGDNEAILESDCLPFDVSSLTEVSALSIDCAAARNISLASMRGITQVQIGRMEEASRYYYSLPLLPSRLKELCLILVDEDDIIGAVESQTELRSLTIRKNILNKYAALFAQIQNSRFENKPQEKWSKLEALTLQSCGLKHFPSQISEQKDLKRLDLNSNRDLKSLPEDIGKKLQNLEELDLRGCGLQQLPNSLSNLTALKKIDLSGNSDLKSLPEDIGTKLQNLEKLYLAGCGLQQLPISLNDLSALKMLDLSRNRKLKSYPEGIGTKLKKLKELDLHWCGLQQFPSCLSNLTALKQLA